MYYLRHRRRIKRRLQLGNSEVNKTWSRYCPEYMYMLLKTLPLNLNNEICLIIKICFLLFLYFYGDLGVLNTVSLHLYPLRWEFSMQKDEGRS